MKLLSCLHIVLLFSLGLWLISCSTDSNDYSYKGSNYVQISTSVGNNPTILTTSETPIKVDVLTATTSEQDETIEFELVNNGDGEGLLHIDAPVLLKAGEKNASFLIKSNQVSELEETQVVTVRFKSATNARMVAWNELNITVKPNPAAADLTSEQKAYIKGYKEKYGLDLNNIIGELSCHVNIKFPDADRGMPGVGSEVERDYTSTSIITLSEDATADTPILKFIYNPLGLDAVFYQVLCEIAPEGETWEYDEFRSNILKVIEYDSSKESFAMTLDHIVLNPRDKTISFTAMNEDEEKMYIPFQYTYTAWERMQQKASDGAYIEIQENDSKVQYTLDDCINLYGITLDPAYYLGYSTIEYDDWGDDTYVSPQASYDLEKGTMTFVFPWDYEMASGYTQIRVTYTMNK